MIPENEEKKEQYVRSDGTVQANPLKPYSVDQSGPIQLGSSKRGILTLGSIKSGSPAYQPSPKAAESDSKENIDQTTEQQSNSEVSYKSSYVPPVFSPPVTTVPPIYTATIETKNRRASAPTSWSPVKWEPRIDRDAFVHPNAIVIGNVIIDAGAFIAPGVIIRGDNEEPIYIGEGSYLQEGSIIRDLPTRGDDEVKKQRIVEYLGNKYSVYIGRKVVLSPQAQVHGPARIEDGAYIGMQSLVFWAVVGEGVVLEPGCLVMNVFINKKVFIPAGLKVTSSKIVSDLPPLTSQYRFYNLCRDTIEEMEELHRGYKALMD